MRGRAAARRLDDAVEGEGRAHRGRAEAGDDAVQPVRASTACRPSDAAAGPWPRRRAGRSKGRRGRRAPATARRAAERLDGEHEVADRPAEQGRAEDEGDVATLRRTGGRARRTVRPRRTRGRRPSTRRARSTTRPGSARGARRGSPRGPTPRTHRSATPCAGCACHRVGPWRRGPGRSRRRGREGSGRPRRSRHAGPCGGRRVAPRGGRSPVGPSTSGGARVASEHQVRQRGRRWTRRRPRPPNTCPTPPCCCGAVVAEHHADVSERPAREVRQEPLAVRRARRRRSLPTPCRGSRCSSRAARRRGRSGSTAPTRRWVEPSARGARAGRSPRARPRRRSTRRR